MIESQVRCKGVRQDGRPCTSLLALEVQGYVKIVCSRCGWVNTVDSEQPAHIVRPPRLTKPRPAVTMGQSRILVAVK